MGGNGSWIDRLVTHGGMDHVIQGGGHSPATGCLLVWSLTLSCRLGSVTQ